VTRSPEKVLVLGGSGQLGTALAGLLETRGVSHAAPGRGEVDLEAADLGRVLERRAPDTVINASAFNDVNGAERAEHRRAALLLNVEVPGRLARACAERGARLVHVSTDYVFDGRKTTPYVEDDPVSPLQFYGRTKLEGEREVLGAAPGALVVRTSTLYGRDRRGGRNYVSAVLANARANPLLEVVRPPVSSPTHAADLAAAILDLLEVGATGVVHVANAGGCSRLELATEAVRLAGLATRVTIRERPAPPGGAARPAYSVFDTSRFTRWTGKTMAPWQEALAAYVARL